MTTGFRSITHLVWVRWALWLLFWTAVGFFFSTQTVLRSAPEEGVWLAAFRHTMPHWYVWGAMTPLIAWSDRWASRVHTSASVRIGLHGPFAVLWCSAVIFLTTGVNGALGQTIPPFSLSWLASQYHWNVLIYTVIVGVLVAYDYQRQATERAIHSSALEARLAQARLETLKAQLHPHFLFNTLNAISTLILDGANETANLTVSRLSDFLRYTLDNDPMKRVSLGSELGALDLYLEIEKVRFGERLVVQKDVEPRALEALVPSLILQPLIENAIKYAINPSEDGGTLKISAKVHNGILLLQLADNGPGLGNGDSSKKSCGVGLRNTRERLQQAYGDAQAFTLAPNDPSGLVITINIPFETDEKTQDPDS